MVWYTTKNTAMAPWMGTRLEWRWLLIWSASPLVDLFTFSRFWVSCHSICGHFHVIHFGSSETWWNAHAFQFLAASLFATAGGAQYEILRFCRFNGVNFCNAQRTLGHSDLMASSHIQLCDCSFTLKLSSRPLGDTRSAASTLSAQSSAPVREAPQATFQSTKKSAKKVLQKKQPLYNSKPHNKSLLRSSQLLSFP